MRPARMMSLLPILRAFRLIGPPRVNGISGDQHEGNREDLPGVSDRRAGIGRSGTHHPRHGGIYAVTYNGEAKQIFCRNSRGSLSGTAAVFRCAVVRNRCRSRDGAECRLGNTPKRILRAVSHVLPPRQHQGTREAAMQTTAESRPCALSASCPELLRSGKRTFPRS